MVASETASQVCSFQNNALELIWLAKCLMKVIVIIGLPMMPEILSCINRLVETEEKENQ